ncbi:MAG: DNA polymerase Y family protein, partial [bacterium]|nr:DNA polymerase Y family protein [bacterium]
MDRLACVDLHVDAADLDPVKDRAIERLRRFSPDVEPAPDVPGIFWIDAAGLSRLHVSPKKWAQAILSDLNQLGFRASVVVGFTRFGTFALARVRRGALVLRCPDQEAAEACKVPLRRLRLDLPAIDDIIKLGKRDVGGLLTLPRDGLLERFGPDIYRLYCFAAGDL